MIGDSQVAILSPLCLHVFAHAVPLAWSSLSNLLTSRLLASHYSSIKITLGPPPPKGLP